MAGMNSGRQHVRRTMTGAVAVGIAAGATATLWMALLFAGASAAHADALCDQLRAQYGPGWPCVSVPPPQTVTPPSVGDAPGAPQVGGNGPQAGAGGLNPGPGNGTPIVPVPGGDGGAAAQQPSVAPNDSDQPGATTAPAQVPTVPPATGEASAVQTPPRPPVGNTQGNTPDATTQDNVEQVEQFTPADPSDGDDSEIPLAAWVVGGAAALTAAHPRAGQALRRVGGGARSLAPAVPARGGSPSLVTGILPAGGSERAQVGSMRLVLINDALSPKTYVFDMDVPPGGHTEVNPDGSATVFDAEGDPVAQIAKPWAYDSLGRPQKTWYTVDADGNLVQHVEASDNAVYPILADPNKNPSPGAAATAVNVLPPEDPGSGNLTGNGGTTVADPPPYDPPQFEPVPDAPPAQTLDNQPGPADGGSGEPGGSVPGPGKPPEPVQGNDIDPGFDNVDIPFAGDPFFQIGFRPNLDSAFDSIGQPSAGAAQVGMADADGNIWQPGIFNEPGIKGPGFYITIDGVRVVLIPLPDGGYQIWQNNHLWIYNADETLRDYKGQVPDPGFVYEKPLGPDVLSAALAFSSLPPGIKAAIAGAAQSIGKPAIPGTPSEPSVAGPPDKSLLNPKKQKGPWPGPVPNLVPPDWTEKPNSKGIGSRWADPANPQENRIRIDKGDPNSNWPSQRVDHVVVISGGKVIGIDGQPINPTDTAPRPSQTPEAHIPLSEWIKWETWNTP